MNKPNTAAIAAIGEIVLKMLSSANVDMDEFPANLDNYRRNIRSIATLVHQLEEEAHPGRKFTPSTLPSLTR